LMRNQTLMTSWTTLLVFVKSVARNFDMGQGSAIARKLLHQLSSGTWF